MLREQFFLISHHDLCESETSFRTADSHYTVQRLHDSHIVLRRPIESAIVPIKSEQLIEQLQRSEA